MKKHIKTYVPFLKYIASLLLFGSNGVIAKHISLSSYEIVFMRTLIGSLFLVIIYKYFHHDKSTKIKNMRHLIYIIISGVAMGTSWIFLYEAYQQIGVSIASLLYYCGPIIVMVISPLLFSEKLTLQKILGFSVVVIGVLFLNINSFQDKGTEWGVLYGGVSAALYALMIIFNKKAKSITGIQNSVYQLVVSFVTLAIFIGIRQGFIIHITNENWIPLIILGLINTGIGCYLYFSSINNLPIQTVSICGYIELLSAVIFSVMFLDEILHPLQILGVILVIGGAAFSELYKSNKINT